MTDTQTDPVAVPPPANAGFVMLGDGEIQSYRARLIEAGGDMERAAITMAEMRNIIYTCRMKANPMQEAAEAAKEKKPRSVSTKKETLSGDAVNGFLE